MKLEYSLNMEDYLVFQLFTASKSYVTRNNRRKNKILPSIAFIILSLTLYKHEGIALAISFLILSLLWFLFYPFFERKRYIDYYTKHINENYKNRYGKNETLEFKEDYILSRDYSGETKLILSEIEELNEINDYFFIKFNSGVSLIIPKSKIDNLNEFSEYLKDLIFRLHIRHNIELTWKWK